LFSTLRLPAVI